MKQKFIIILLTVFFLMTAAYGKEPYKLGKFDTFKSVYKQIKLDGKPVIFISAGFNGFLAIEQSELTSFMELLKTMSKIYKDHEQSNHDTVGKDEKINIAIPSFGGMVGVLKYI